MDGKKLNAEHTKDKMNIPADVCKPGESSSISNDMNEISPPVSLIHEEEDNKTQKVHCMEYCVNKISKVETSSSCIKCVGDRRLKAEQKDYKQENDNPVNSSRSIRIQNKPTLVKLVNKAKVNREIVENQLFTYEARKMSDAKFL